jgi:hypothetical protein
MPGQYDAVGIKRNALINLRNGAFNGKFCLTGVIIANDL